MATAQRVSVATTRNLPPDEQSAKVAGPAGGKRMRVWTITVAGRHGNQAGQATVYFYFGTGTARTKALFATATVNVRSDTVHLSFPDGVDGAVNEELYVRLYADVDGQPLDVSASVSDL